VLCCALCGGMCSEVFCEVHYAVCCGVKRILVSNLLRSDLCCEDSCVVECIMHCLQECVVKCSLHCVVKCSEVYYVVCQSVLCAVSKNLSWSLLRRDLRITLQCCLGALATH
jgi:hypothetical protein